MRRTFEDELDRLKSTILTMAGRVESCLDLASRALVERNAKLAKKVIRMDDAIDQLEVEIDRQATEFLVRYQPTATDLRFVVAAIKLGPELERVADNAVNIARRVRELQDEGPLKPLIDLPRMLALARAMVSDAIMAYIRHDAIAAREVILSDDEVDDLNMQIVRELVAFMVEDASTITRGLALINIARCAERIADQATNIAEEVVYLVEGQPIRHRSLERPDEEE